MNDTAWIAIGAIATALLALGTFGFVIAAFMQLREIEKTGMDATKAANAALRSAKAGERIVEVVRAQVEIARQQTDITQRAMGAQFQPVLSGKGLVHEPTNPPRFRAYIENVGPGVGWIGRVKLSGGQLDLEGAPIRPVIAPGGTATLLFWSTAATNEVANAIQNVEIEVAMKDQLGTEREPARLAFRRDGWTDEKLFFWRPSEAL
jgi:hypothetical protein